MMIISDRVSQFIACFWEQLHVSLGTRLFHSSAYHPQMDGQTERVNQLLEDMLRVCVMEYPGSWDKICHGLNFHTTTATKKV
jgi:hypothetical protein